MNIVYFLVIFLVLLLIYTMISTIIKLSLYLTTGTKYDNIRLFIPFILTVIVWVALVSLCILTINKFLNKNIFEEVMELYLIKESIIPVLRPSLTISCIYLLIGVILQALTYFTVNIPLEKILSNIRYGIKKLFRINSNPKHNKIIVKEYVNELYLANSFLASLLSTVLILFSVVALTLIGLYISNRFKF